MSVYESRTRRLQNLLRRNGVDAAVILSLGSYLYFTGDVRKQPRVVIPSEGEPFLIVFESEEEEAKNNTWIRDVRTYRSLHQMMAAIMTAAKEQKWKKVGFEFDFFLPAFLNERFKMAVPTVEVVDIHELVTSLKMIKDEQEIGLIRKAAEIAVEGMKTAIEYVEEGVTENEVAAEAEYAMRKLGAEGTAFPTFVNSGPRSLWLHGLVTHRKIEEGDLVIIDLGPVYHGYAANMCRTINVGSASEGKRRLYNVYLTMQRTVINNVKPGVKVLDLENLAFKIVRDAGYGEYYVRGIGHGIGLTFEETPMPTIFPQDVLVELRPKMVFTVGHPVLSVPGIGGVRIEDTLLVTEDGNEKLTEYPDTLIEKVNG